jgi:hypothetical protein
MNIPKEFQNDLRFRYIYIGKGRCPKCNHRTQRIRQAGPVPPRIMCIICGCSTWEDKGFTFNADLAVGR